MKANKSLYGVVTLLLTVFPIQSQTYNPPFVSYTPVYDVTQRNLRQVVLDDGVYEVLVDYKSNTTSREQYVLDVRIQNDNITHIYFNNGGYVHNGVNYSDYTWRGGGIRWNVDYSGNIISGYAVIQLTYEGGRWQLFTIDF
jgi:hypothetical protein